MTPKTPDKRIKQDSTLKPPKKKKYSPAPLPPSDFIFAKGQIPVNETFINRMIEELPEWPLKNPQAKTMIEYYLSKGLSEVRYYQLLDRNPKLKEAHQIAMSIIGNRLFSRAIDRDADWGPIKWALHNYTQLFDDNNKYHARVRAEAEKHEADLKGNKEYIVERVIEYRDKPTE